MGVRFGFKEKVRLGAVGLGLGLEAVAEQGREARVGAAAARWALEAGWGLLLAEVMGPFWRLAKIERAVRVGLLKRGGFSGFEM